MKDEFILDNVWYLTISGAFQRAYIYKDGISEKEVFKKDLRKSINEIAEKYKNDVKVEDSEHLANIYKIMGARHNCLKNDSLNFGISQKLLNLYLKYYWCLGKIPAPPHFPVDRIIQVKLGVEVKPWTQMADEAHYLKVIQKAKDAIKGNNNYTNIAELELDLYSGKELRK